MTVTLRPAPVADKRKVTARRRAAVRLVLSVALMGAAFLGVLPRVASYDTAWERLFDAHRAELALLLITGVWNLASYLPLLVLALPGLTFRQAAISAQVSTAVANTVPAGGAWGAGLTVAMYRRWGFPGPEITRALLVTGLWNVSTKLLLGVAASVALLTMDDDAPIGLGVTSAVLLFALVTMVALAVRRPGLADSVGAMTEKAAGAVARLCKQVPPTGWARSVERLRRDLGELLTARWRALTLAALLSHFSLFAVLFVAMGATGLNGVTVVEAFSVFSVVRVALLVPLTPGGAGIAEVGLSILLVSAGGGRPEAVAAVLVYRAVTWGLPVVIGAVCWLLWIREGDAAAVTRS